MPPETIDGMPGSEWQPLRYESQALFSEVVVTGATLAKMWPK